ncbi:MAG TPA: conjugal transfer protein TraG [Hyphomonadaceae bacterium]|nr:conjugal transfer protein TraG [Hyphomonadaceae bacterium]
MRAVLIVAIGLMLGLAAMSAATNFIVETFNRQPALGAPLFRLDGAPVYAPWAIFTWTETWAETYPKPFAVARFIVFAGLCLSLLPLLLLGRGRIGVKPFGQHAWGGVADADAAGLLATTGTILGRLGRDILCFAGLEHQLLIGASRSGKGRGHVVPTLLAWPHSALVLDVKGELADGDARHGFAGTSGFRASLGPVLRFAPTRLESNAFNPLFEVRKGANEIRDVQNIVEILVDPAGDGRNQDFWDRSAKAVLVGIILHVLYAEPIERKTLAIVREKLRDLDATALAMKATLHRLNPRTQMPEVHPEVLHAAESFLAGEERLKAGVKATAESFFGLFADEIIARNTKTSDFRIGDLMCAERPVTLYLQPPPSDALRLMPLLRVLVNQIARALMEHQGADSLGRKKRHRLILVLDEFPVLGRMPFFETMMGAMAGYGLKAFLVTQSLNHITKAYGRDNVILDNCHIVTSFAAADTETAKRIAEMAGEVWELRESETLRRPRPILGLWGHGSTTMREERRALLLPGEVRALPRDEELIFIAGTKPIRAKKLKFDREPVFKARLKPPSRALPQLTIAHDWVDVRALGALAPVAPKRAKAKPALASARPAQRDLFPENKPRKGGLAEAASKGFRDETGAPLPHPSLVVAASNEAPGAPPAEGER